MKTKKQLERKIPLRKCCVTGEQLPKRHMLRIVRNSEGVVSLDLIGRANGRGAYVSATKATYDLALETKALEKALNVEEIPQSVYAQLKEYCK